MDCLAVANALGVFTFTEAEVEAQLDQVSNLMDFWVGGDGRCGHNGVDNVEGDGLFSFDRRILDVLGFKLTNETSVQSGVGLRVWRISWVGKVIQEVVRQKYPPMPKKRTPSQVVPGVA